VTAKWATDRKKERKDIGMAICDETLELADQALERATELEGLQKHA
jgi:hypothetical protein